ncbi:unnamed protein product, partial [Mesorhabditis belari]|uniref:Protein kinase domain-containing protein n=1 Tax=Mesorhabditis belari TaxID=2138241 RepID=A0AAF3FBI6_9BILA
MQGASDGKLMVEDLSAGKIYRKGVSDSKYIIIHHENKSVLRRYRIEETWWRSLENKRLIDNELALLKLKHPNLVLLIKASAENGWYQIELEYVSRISLDKLIFNSQYEYSHKTIIHLTGDILDGLHFLHEHGYLYRDCKSANVMLTLCGRAKLIDFETGKVLPEGRIATEHSQGIGSTEYRAPETFNGVLDSRGQFTKKSDVWSVGVIIFEMGARRVPFPFENGSPQAKSDFILPKIKCDAEAWTLMENNPKFQNADFGEQELIPQYVKGREEFHFPNGMTFTSMPQETQSPIRLGNMEQDESEWIYHETGSDACLFRQLHTHEDSNDAMIIFEQENDDFWFNGSSDDQSVEIDHRNDDPKVTNAVGTPSYQSPEALNSNLVDWAKNDIYSLGLVLWELVERRIIFETLSRPRNVEETIFTEDLCSSMSNWKNFGVKASDLLDLRKLIKG